MANNIVDIKSIGSILNGKNYFYVPCYQRGYRWNWKQVEELLSDLYSFRKQYDRDKASHVGNFYCLQPIIVREITDVEVRKLVLESKFSDNTVKLWELVDGQQRLTSIYILLSYLISKVYRGDMEDFKEDNNGAEIYSLFYESHPETCLVLSDIAEGKTVVPNDINSTHICNALRYIDEWFEGKGMEINKRYSGGDGESIRKMRNHLLDQLVNTSEEGPTKVIWYQLSNDEDVDPIQEFTRINNGKIPLTDTELIKALFLQKKNFTNGNNILEQAKVSLVWEQIENELQQNDFWCFISNKSIDEEDRMGELLKLVYLKKQDKEKEEIESGDIFRFYYNILDGLPSDRLQTTIESLWTEIVDTFHTLQDWYETPEIYNYVGYLTQSGMHLAQIYKQSQDLQKEKEECTIDDFLSLLKKDIRSVLPKNCVEIQDDKTPRIVTEYPDRPNLRKILLLLNVEILSKQLLEIRDKEESYTGDANVFKFPYDLYKSQEWDIEHIDSATTNTLADKEAQKNWVEANIKDYNIKITDAIKKKIENGEWSDLIGIIQEQEGEEAENKNFIGNLTLLDSSTNREYGNALFRKKREYIIDKVMNGRYVLPCTQYVFMKFFDMKNVTESRARWTKEDKNKYHDFIYQQLKEYLPIQKKSNL